MSHKWNYFVCAKSELYTFNDYWITRSTEWQLFTTYQTVFSHLIKLVKVVKNKFVEKIANNFLEHSKAPPKFDDPFWNDVTYSDEYVLYADLLPVCDGIYRNTTTVLPSVCSAKKKAQKIVSKFSRKIPNFFDEWKAYREINFFSFTLIFRLICG